MSGMNSPHRAVLHTIKNMDNASASRTPTKSIRSSPLTNGMKNNMSTGCTPTTPRSNKRFENDEQQEEEAATASAAQVGFGLLPDQAVNKAVSRGFCFNVLCVGATGIGKSTLLETLFNTPMDSTPSSHNLPGVTLQANTYSKF